MTGKVDDKGFLQRWSTRKTEARVDGDENLPTVDEAETPQDGAAPDTDVQAPPPNLPDVETLDADSDFTAFLGENVPQDLAKMALRKLWRSDPVLANLDGLNDYDDDFSKVGMVSEAVKTAYQVGKGFLTDEDDVEATDAHDTDADEALQSETLESDDSALADEDLAADVTDETPSEGEKVAMKFHDTENIKPT